MAISHVLTKNCKLWKWWKVLQDLNIFQNDFCFVQGYLQSLIRKKNRTELCVPFAADTVGADAPELLRGWDISMS